MCPGMFQAKVCRGNMSKAKFIIIAPWQLIWRRLILAAVVPSFLMRRSASWDELLNFDRHVLLFSSLWQLILDDNPITRVGGGDYASIEAFGVGYPSVWHCGSRWVSRPWCWSNEKCWWIGTVAKFSCTEGGAG